MTKQTLWVLPVLVCLTAFSMSAGVVTLTNSVTGNFDASSGTRTVTVTGLEPGYGTGTISDVIVSINFAKADGESFTPPFPGGTPFYNEIHFGLTAPSGTVVDLIAASSWGSGSGQFDGTITFDNAAASVVNSGAGPVAGTYRPTGPGTLADFNTQSALGTWTLFIQDTVGADSLRFREFELSITTDGTGIPEPGTILLMGAGLAGLALYRRRK